MKQKLTLTIDEEAIKLAKRMAKRRRTSVSKLVEEQIAQWGQSVARDKDFVEKWGGKLPVPTTKQLRGDTRLRHLLEKHAPYMVHSTECDTA